MIFDEQPGTIVPLFGISHVAFGGTNVGKFLHSLVERQILQPRLILTARLGLAMGDQRVQRIVTKNGTHLMKKLNRQIGMRIGETV